MNLDVKAIHCDLDPDEREMIRRKAHRFDYADGLVVDLLLSIHGVRNSYRAECTTNFRWGTQAHLSVESAGLKEGIDILFDKLDQKIHKEKEKIQDHSAPVILIMKFGGGSRLGWEQGTTIQATSTRLR